jgi:hypothetical protein
VHGDPLSALKTLAIVGSPTSSQSPNSRISPQSSNGFNGTDDSKRKGKNKRRIRAAARPFADINSDGNAGLDQDDYTLSGSNPSVELVLIFNCLIYWSTVANHMELIY